jgi:hypothetical protein
MKFLLSYEGIIVSSVPELRLAEENLLQTHHLAVGGVVGYAPKRI